MPDAVYRCEVDGEWTMLGIGDDIERITGLSGVRFHRQRTPQLQLSIHPADRVRVHAECRRAIGCAAAEIGT